MKKKKSKKDSVLKEKEAYKKRIIDMVENINDEWILKQIYRMIINIAKEGS